MAKYIFVFGAVAGVTGYYAYKYMKIAKGEVQNFLNTLILDRNESKNEILALKRRLNELEEVINELKTKSESRTMTTSVGEDLTKSFSIVQLENEPSNTTEKYVEENLRQKANAPDGDSKDLYVEEMLAVIENVKKEGAELEQQIRQYKGSAGDRIYKQFNEKLIQKLIKLDLIYAKGHENLRETKKDALEYLKSIQILLKTR